MTFELGKQYIVEVTKNGIIPTEEFKRERFFDKDSDSLDFLTDEEKVVVINGVLDKIRAEIQEELKQDNHSFYRAALKDVIKIIDRYEGNRNDTVE